jgi:hypothetical protein
VEPTDPAELEPSPRPPIATAPISVVLFAHALATDTQGALQAWRQYLDTLQRPYEIFLIQETRSEVPATPVADLPDAAKPTRVFEYERTIGFRDALDDAIRATQYPLVAFCRADRQYQPADLERMLAVIDKVDLVAGYRAGGKTPWWRVVLDTVIELTSRFVLGVPLEPRVCWLGAEGWGRRWVARWIFGLRVVDPECPFRLARREIFLHLPIQSGGPFVHVEILAKANHLSCLLAEEGVTWTPPIDATTDAISFGHDARLVFGTPDFGPYPPREFALARRPESLPTDAAVPGV